MRRRTARPARPSSSGVALGPLFELFHPSAKHVEEQRQTETMLRDDEESGDPPLGIDLDAGRAVIRLRRPEPPGDDAA
ncbi:MAG: hypothetical protein QOF82_2946 [Frankiales bacterium]|jgi:hypothetical protein|nr:hypothetical protein [Frankiales bacterium]MDX6213859.1 hypothetical protein [Frankiales bacterium]MDX6222467.1 hypothetical protein [Frankiales bacterium]